MDTAGFVLVHMLQTSATQCQASDASGSKQGDEDKPNDIENAVNGGRDVRLVHAGTYAEDEQCIEHEHNDRHKCTAENVFE